MLALYHRLARSCRTRNQLNKVHIALENRMTPNELLELWHHYHQVKRPNPPGLSAATLLQMTRKALFAGNPLAAKGSGAVLGSFESDAREWTSKLQEKLLLAGRSGGADFSRERLAHSAARYSNRGPRCAKTLLFCFTGNAHRMMMPMPIFLQHLDPNEVDVVYLRTEKHAGYRNGIQGIGTTLPSSVSHLMERCQAADYARIAVAGTSGGGMPALLAGLQMGASAVLAVGPNSPDDPRWAEFSQGGDGVELFRHFMRDPHVLPAIHLVHGADHPRDGMSNQRIARCIHVSSITSVENCGHSALFSLVERGQFHDLLRSTILPEPVAEWQLTFEGGNKKAMRYLDRLTQHATHRGDRQAIVSIQLSLSYAELLGEVQQRMDRLPAMGVQQDEVIGLQVSDEAEHLILSLALMGMGTRQITLATFDSENLHDQIARRAGVTRRLSDRDALALKQPLSQEPVSRQSDHSGMLYLKTSGTTGSIHIVPFTESQMAAQSERHREYADERLLRLASIEHNNSKRHRLYCIWMGGTNVFKPHGLFDLIEFVQSQNVTCLDISRMHAADIASLAGVNRLAGVKLRTGGSAVPYALRKRLEEEVTPDFYVRYAATECGAIAMAGPGQHSAAEGVGRPLDGVRLEIVDDSDQPLPNGGIGQIRIRAAGVAEGYLDSPQDSLQRFRNGWFYPGDLGLVDSDGTLVLQGRSDDMIILNGLNIFPAEIEHQLEAHPSVRSAAALGLPSAVHGQIPVAAIELHPGSQLDLAALKLELRQTLGLKAPRRILQLDNLPRNPQGKILKRELLEMFMPTATSAQTSSSERAAVQPRE